MSTGADPTAPGHRPVLALVGMRGVGKTTVGRALAPLVGRPFLDHDERTLLYGHQAGWKVASVAELLEKAGLATFRDLEAAALRQVLEPQIACVLATGGGALERADNRTWLSRTAFVVWLDARVDTLRARIAAEPGTRPGLLGTDPLAEVATLARQRAALYASVAQLRLPTDEDGAGPGELARAIQRAWSATGTAGAARADAD